MVATESLVIFEVFGVLVTDETLAVSDLLNLFSTLTTLERNSCWGVGERAVFARSFEVETHTYVSLG
jgi:hypothetical protein